MIRSEGVKPLAKALEVNASLTSLDLGWNQISPEGGTAVAEALKVNASLTSLDIYDTQIGNEGAKSLADALRVNASLTTANLLRNNLDAESAALLASAAKERRVSLCGIAPDQTKANFRGWGLTPVDAILVAHDLYVRASLTSLDICRNKIGWPECWPDGKQLLRDAVAARRMEGLAYVHMEGLI